MQTAKRAKHREALRARLRRVLGRSLELLERDIETLTPRELLQLADIAGRYGLGTQQEVEVNETRRYVVRLPSRVDAAVRAVRDAGPVAVLNPGNPAYLVKGEPSRSAVVHTDPATDQESVSVPRKAG